MKKSRHKEEQIIAVLKEVDAGAKLQDVVRRLGISEQTYLRIPVAAGQPFWKDLGRDSGMTRALDPEAPGRRFRCNAGAHSGRPGQRET